ncbi:MAG TPA: rod shape-determining protein MreC [Ignavibacteriaceae bacterium]|jgi:rod shape-determining protein MreC|nr:MAG: Cell shape-determining protein MreC precursor [Ignavibacteria bacterium ADurb.Bin266]OQY74389.1 MAG: rod shape-determining protein MreC [Ignavibacteriales bacterium UTCHB2]HQF41699.1 rod shape-determining protein MreC [Ignavibacteriaceae bacterium]HQI42167.1 rod shape-determining protein MreC [Ignavibacteriaceae bacterium]HQJ46313.1 rod shape-determining protein MreC [Ignavibacteriaceae bacterium]
MIRFISSTWEKFKEYIVLVVLIIISLALLSQNNSQGIQKVRAVAFGSFASVTSVFSDIFNISNLKKENEELRRTNAEIMLQLSRLRESAIVNDDLKGLLALKDSTKYPLIIASIISKSLSKSQGTVTLNVGSSSGVKPGMPVITDKGIAGIIFSVSANYSIARTLNNVDLNLTVKCERTRENAVMKWKGDRLVMINVPKTFGLKKGDRIVTSEISSIVPVPIPVGIVAEIGNVEMGIFNEVTIQPFVDFQKVENVFVLGLVKSKEIDDIEFNFLNKR